MKLLQEQTKFWHAQDIGNLELLRATYITHAFTRHTHEAYAIGVIERGAETFYYRNGTHVAPAGSIVVINPGEVHTGQALTEIGWSYRMLYPQVELVQKAARLAGNVRHTIPDFPKPVIYDDKMVTVLRNLHQVLEKSTSKLERESHFVSALAQLVARHADGRATPIYPSADHQAIARVQGFLESHYNENISLEQLADIAGLSLYHFLRLFREQLGLPPHAYLNQLRIEQAKKLLVKDWPIAHVAAETGFVDQSHFTRRFKQIVGVTPGQYSKNIQD